MLCNNLVHMNDITTASANHCSWPTRTVQLPIGALTISMETIASFDAVLDDFATAAPNDTDKIPYFAEIWPSALALAEFLAENRDLLANKEVIELGCGLGLPSIVAAKCGARSVIATDFHPACLPYCFANIEKNDVSDVVTCRHLDWRVPSIGQTFDCIIGSDLLYEAPQINALLQCIAHIQRPHTILILADPLRKHIQPAADQLQQSGWHIDYQPVGEIMILTAKRSA